MKCGEFRAMAESYAAGELPVDTNHLVITHLERCAACQQELDARAALRQTLRRAFTSSADLAPSERLVSAVRARVSQSQTAPSRLSVVAPWLGIAAVIALAVISGVRFMRSDEPRSAAPEMLMVAHEAAADHRDCALNHALKDPVISLQEAGRRYHPVYAGLRDAVAGTPTVLAGALVLVGAHWCVLDGRHFGHVVLRRERRVISLLLTPMAGVASGHADATSCRQAEGFQVACFSAPGYAIFVVSDLTTAENLQITRSLAPMLQAYLRSA